MLCGYKYQKMSTTKTKIEVSQDSYLSTKKLILSGEQFVRIDLDLKDLKIKTIKKVEIDNREVNISKAAVAELIEMLGINKSFYDLLNRSFEHDTEIVNLILSAVKGTKIYQITLVFNTLLNEIVKIYQTGSKLISDTQYFESLESILAKTPGSYLRNIVVYPNGNLSATIANPELAFSYENRADEEFTGGMTLEMMDSKLMTSFFTERLVCSNGMTVKDKICTRSIRSNSDVPMFMEALMSPEFHINSITAFRDRLARIINTTASLAEVLQTESRLKNTLGTGIEGELLLDGFAAKGLRNIFGEDTIRNVDIHKYLRTNITVWDLVNQVTAISSKIEQNKMKVDARVNRGLQVIGGNLMFSNPNLPPRNIRQIFKD